jgi:hypothetical protein
MKLKFIIDEEYDKSFIKDEKTLQRADELYKSSLKYIELTKKLYQDSWDEINNDFSDYIKKETGYDWFYDTYECVVSVIHRGFSNWGRAAKIVRGWQENPYFMRRITAHELILSHYFEIYRRHYSKDEDLTLNQVWALAEIAAWALTSLTNDVKKFWPWNTEYYAKHNYPQLVEIQNKLGPIFLKRKTFDDYIRAGIAEIKKYPEIGPT